MGFLDKFFKNKREKAEEKQDARNQMRMLADLGHAGAQGVKRA